MRDAIATAVGHAFYARYGRAPKWIVSAPGRVNLIGEFTDYNDGFVLPMAIDRRTVIAAAPTPNHQIILHSEAAGESVRIDVNRPVEREPGVRWPNYPKGVLAAFQGEGLRPGGFDALIASDVPLGAGLSSSAALTCAMAALLEIICGATLEPLSKALLCQQAEHQFAGVPCGIMDPVVCTAGREGHAMLLDCRSRETAWLPLSDPDVAVLIVNTNVKHQLAHSEYGLRRQQCERVAQLLQVPSLRHADPSMIHAKAAQLDDVSVRRARHVTSENERVLDAADCLRHQDWSGFGRLLDASHESLRDDFVVSCRELDTVVEIARSIGSEGGIFGCRMTGGGFGGCVLALIRSAQQLQIIEEIATQYRQRTGITATCLVARAAAGARQET